MTSHVRITWTIRAPLAYKIVGGLCSSSLDSHFCHPAKQPFVSRRGLPQVPDGHRLQLELSHVIPLRNARDGEDVSFLAGDGTSSLVVPRHCLCWPLYCPLDHHCVFKLNFTTAGRVGH